ncbi:SIMPL domain-containing protein [Streptomyces sp. NBC_01180]|uniref:SIMPL domain-containing protein n=1 Tax=Streptomyces sp. NBC_01180 TaxID=2903763 RepID=UPI00386F3CD6|nr:SIMPL domain-containing protein [Streptomyces sp. NBC_01180]
MTDEVPYSAQAAAAPPAAPQPTAPRAAVPYGTPDTPRVAVRGEASLEVEPETATLTVTTSARGKDRRAALQDLTRRNAAILELARGYGEAVEKLESGALSVSPEPAQHGRGEKVRAYSGHVRITVVLNDFTALGDLTSRLADQELTRVEGPWWALRPGSPARRDARRQAVRDAVTRAREYAGALGAELTALVELSDPGADDGARPPAPGFAGARGFRAAAPGAADDAPAIDLEPQRQTVHAQVNARFTMSPPAL